MPRRVVAATRSINWRASTVFEGPPWRDSRTSTGSAIGRSRNGNLTTTAGDHEDAAGGQFLVALGHFQRAVVAQGAAYTLWPTAAEQGVVDRHGQRRAP